jgi:hypothetical protein
MLSMRQVKAEFYCEVKLRPGAHLCNLCPWRLLPVDPGTLKSTLWQWVTETYHWKHVLRITKLQRENFSTGVAELYHGNSLKVEPGPEAEAARVLRLRKC